MFFRTQNRFRLLNLSCERYLNLATEYVWKFGWLELIEKRSWYFYDAGTDTLYQKPGIKLHPKFIWNDSLDSIVSHHLRYIIYETDGINITLSVNFMSA